MVMQPNNSPLPAEAREWEGAWPVVEDDSAALDTAAAGARLQTPLRMLASNMRETLSHVRAFPALAQALREEVREVEGLLEFARQDTIVTVVDWRRDAASSASSSAS
eukprot:CAMPEP_0197601134 /NCGR_PEP_ID=MMETSP1326-20131121/34733_1 /TAXON_ID=1155430 /ORGANISM="Genus nov. species nov., Strain RCC2288" /LENGTH=106 /DNA_ID=CAMNT_0043168321 /DNA_START=150 /DNA_END=467 /DNA_ORIENTATION=+